MAGHDGVFQYRIPGLLTSNRGTLIAFCDARMRKEGDPPNKINLVMKRSFDGGRTWESLRTLAENGEGAVADSCGIVDRQTGTLWIFSVYAPVGIGSSNAETGLTGNIFTFKAVKSDDDGATWSPPIDFTPMLKQADWAAGSTGVGRGIRARATAGSSSCAITLTVTGSRALRRRPRTRSWAIAMIMGRLGN